MIAACDEGHLQVVRFLTQSGVDINQQTKVCLLHLFPQSVVYARVTSL